MSKSFKPYSRWVTRDGRIALILGSPGLVSRFLDSYPIRATIVGPYPLNGHTEFTCTMDGRHCIASGQSGLDLMYPEDSMEHRAPLRGYHTEGGR